MDFVSFLVLLIVSAAVSWVLHYPLKYYVTAGTWSFVSKIIVGYIGASYGAAWFGDWLPALAVGGVSLIPAILGAAALLILAVDIGKMVSRA